MSHIFKIWMTPHRDGLCSISKFLSLTLTHSLMHSLSLTCTFLGMTNETVQHCQLVLIFMKRKNM